MRHAEGLTPRNPDIHNALATALARTGNKAEAEKEFAILRSLSSAEHSGRIYRTTTPVVFVARPSNQDFAQVD